MGLAHGSLFYQYLSFYQEAGQAVSPDPEE